MELAREFLDLMKEVFDNSEEYDAFLNSLEAEKSPGLRINPLKWPEDKGIETLPFHLEKLDEPSEGYLYNPEERPGKHVLHEAGAYYLQDPDAMRIAPLLSPKPGEKVLDLCAAPGGKATQLAACMQGRGVLIANEIHSGRAGILSSNLERLGVRNGIVTNESSDKLAERFPVYFDKVLCDAPCSGEGMFRKNPEAISEWSPENVKLCVERQAHILDNAADMVRPGGTLVYSTCTFNRKEDEEQIEAFLTRHKDFSLCEILRLFPHHSRGEGHFGAKLVRAGGETENAAHVSQDTEEEEAAYSDSGLNKKLWDKTKKFSNGREKLTLSRITEKERRKNKGVRKNVESNERELQEKICLEFLEELLSEKGKGILEGKLCAFGDTLFLLPMEAPSLAGIKVLRAGLELGTLKKGRFIPSHALALAMTPVMAVCSVELGADPAVRFIRGESISESDLEIALSDKKQADGWVLMHYMGFSLGWGKLAGRRIQNHYPKGLRRECIC